MVKLPFKKKTSSNNVKEPKVFKNEFLNDLKVFNNLKNRKQTSFSVQLSLKEKQALKATIIKYVNEALQGRAVAACYEIANDELATMLEVVQDDDIVKRFIIQQNAENPNQFIFRKRDLVIVR